MDRPELRRRLTLDVERGAEPIAGHLSDATGTQWSFVGWVQLAMALEEALAAHRPAGGETDAGATDHA